jgi:hypothetical protein
MWRIKREPEEKRFAQAWANQQAFHHTLAYLMGDGNAKAVVSDRDHTVAATVIQWLGSSVGQSFLHELGYSKERVVISGDPVMRKRNLLSIKDDGDEPRD